MGVVELEHVAATTVMYVWATSSGATFALLDVDNPLPRTVHARDPSYGTNEEWRVAVRDHVAVLSDTVILAASLQYPMLRGVVGGGARDTMGLASFGIEPGSWEQATRPEPSLRVMQRLPHWLVSFTFIGSITALDGQWLLVQHARFAGSAGARLRSLFAWEPYAFDVYRANGSRAFHDVRFDRRFLDADSMLYVLATEAPHPWTIAVARPRFRQGSAAMRAREVGWARSKGRITLPSAGRMAKRPRG
jgi:hypothetical protein